MDNIIEIKNKIRKSAKNKNYVNDGTSEENANFTEKYEATGESEFSRDVTHPLDEVLSERHYILSGVHSFLRDRFSSEKNFTGVAPRGYQRADERILEEVSEALMKRRDVDPSDIELRVLEGIVSLFGTVPDRKMKKNAEKVAEKVYGVKDVHNFLTISAHGKALVDNRTGLN